MSVLYDDGRVVLRHGHVLDELRAMPAESVHAVCTSPPFWGLRDYQLESQVWSGDAGHDHAWGDVLPARPGRGNAPGDYSTSRLTNPKRQDEVPRPANAGAFCPCGSWRGALGLEPTPELYTAHLVEVFHEIRRVLRSDGVAWLNLGDCYATGGGKVGEHPGGGEQGARWRGYRGTHTAEGSGKAAPQIQAMGPMTQPNRMPVAGLKPKDLVGIPWMVAFALRADGWWLRSDIIWAKPNPMPESVTDRPTRAHEYLFLLAKSERYYYDAEAIKEPATMKPQARLTPRDFVNGKDAQRAEHRRPDYRLRAEAEQENRTRNRRSVWTIPTQPYSEAHFATFPEDLVKPCVLAGTSECGCCVQCGAPWERVVEKADSGTRQKMADGWATHDGGHGSFHRDGREAGAGGQFVMVAVTLGWRPTCRCPGQRGRAVPCVVLDPFVGAGTTVAVAKELGRRAVGIDLSPAYLALAEKRLRQGVLAL